MGHQGVDLSVPFVVQGSDLALPVGSAFAAR